MPADDGRPDDASGWPTRSTRGHRPTSPPLYAYVLDADDDLAQELDVRLRVGARQLATARDTLRAMLTLTQTLLALTARLRFCQCGRICEPSSATCWRCG